MNRRFLIASAALLAIAASQPNSAEAQLGRLKDKVKAKVDDKINKKIDCAVNEVFKDGKCVKSSEAAGSEDAKAAGPSAKKNARPGEGAWANYDFVPGERVLYFTDFSDDAVGNFPRRMELDNGNWEVVEWEGKRWLRKESSNVGRVRIPLRDPLPQKWTMEFDATIPWNGMVVFTTGDAEGDDWEHGRVTLSGHRAGVLRASTSEGSTITPYETIKEINWDVSETRASDRPVRVRVAVDGDYTKVYLEERRIANVPNAKFTRGNYIVIEASHGEVLISNISINAGGKTMYDALTSTGRLALQGIYFDTGKDIVRPESSGTLKQIADMLKEHGDLKLVIEGHTDNVGNAASNKTLSENRAAAVKAALVSQYGVDEARLSSVGLGDTKPVDKNDTPEGRQKNRRVELVVQK